MTISNNCNIFIPPTFMVDTRLGKGTHTTVQAAINDANTQFLSTGIPVTVALRDCTFTENLTIQAGVNFVGGGSGALIVGNHTWTGNNVKPSFNNISFSNTNSSPMFLCNASSQVGATWQDCFFEVSGGTQLFNLNAGGDFNWLFEDCLVVTQNGGIQSGIISEGAMIIKNCVLLSPGGITDWFESSANGGIQIQSCFSVLGYVYGGGDGFVFGSIVVTSGSTNGLIVADTSAIFCGNSFIQSDAAPVLTQGTAQLKLINVALGSNSSVALQINNSSIILAGFITIAGAAIFPSIAGTGTIKYDHIGFGDGVPGSIDSALTVVVMDTRPYSTAGINHTLATRGHCSFDSTSFAVDPFGFVTFTGGGGGGAGTITGDNSVPLAQIANNWNIFADSGSYTSGSGNTLVIQSPAFSSVTTSATVKQNSGSFVSGIGSIITLPPTVDVNEGDLCMFVAVTAMTFTLQANAGQTINVGFVQSSSGGTATNTRRGDTLSLRYDQGTSTWWDISHNGTWVLA
ncbi:MAG TPA: hypothetical protein VIJ14_07910 [Rhabdochlamydiaceae bacterium]